MKLKQFDCYGDYEKDSQYGCNFYPDMNKEEFKAWVEDGVSEALELTECNLEELRRNCEKCYRRGNNAI